ncbi:hypothetical protein RI367_006285 [Sorochytrium milnesiophthora]
METPDDSPLAAKNLAIVPISNKSSAVAEFCALAAVILSCTVVRRAYFALLRKTSRQATGTTQEGTRGGGRLRSLLHLVNRTGDRLVYAVLLCAYLIITLSFSLCHTYSLGDQCWQRFAWNGVAQFLLAVILSVPHSPLTHMFGRHDIAALPRPMLLFLHQFLAWAGIVFATTHMALNIHSWLDTDFSAFMLQYQLHRKLVHYALVAWISLGLLFVLSLTPVRRKAYGLFWTAHRVFAIMVFVFVYLHRPATVGFTMVALAVVVLSLLYQLYVLYVRTDPKQHTTMATGNGVVKVDVHLPSRQIDVPPGSYIHIIAPGHRRLMTPHPFTVARSSSSAQDGTRLTLYIKPVGHHDGSPAPLSHRVDSDASGHELLDMAATAQPSTASVASASRRRVGFTGQLYQHTEKHGQIASAVRSLANSSSNDGVESPAVPVHTRLSFLGPFRSPVVDAFDAFDDIVLVAGGVGVTPWISWIEYLSRVNADSRDGVDSEKLVRDGGRKRLHLIWVVKGPEVVFHDFTQYPTSTLLSIQVVHTASGGRPAFAPLLANTQSGSDDRAYTQDTAVLVCGPKGMASSVRQAVRHLERDSAGPPGHLWWLFLEKFTI